MVHFFKTVNITNSKFVLTSCVKEILDTPNKVYAKRTFESIKSRYKSYLSLLRTNDLLNIIHFYKNIHTDISRMSNRTSTLFGILQRLNCILLYNKTSATFEIEFNAFLDRTDKRFKHPFINLDSQYSTIIQPFSLTESTANLKKPKQSNKKIRQDIDNENKDMSREC